VGHLGPSVALSALIGHDSEHNFSNTFDALADSTRRAVLDLLRKGAQPAGQIAGAFLLCVPQFSKHLHQLRRARLSSDYQWPGRCYRFAAQSNRGGARLAGFQLLGAAQPLALLNLI
jgi:hypothetical protein